MSNTSMHICHTCGKRYGSILNLKPIQKGRLVQYYCPACYETLDNGAKKITGEKIDPLLKKNEKTINDWRLNK